MDVTEEEVKAEGEGAHSNSSHARENTEEEAEAKGLAKELADTFKGKPRSASTAKPKPKAQPKTRAATPAPSRAQNEAQEAKDANPKTHKKKTPKKGRSPKQASPAGEEVPTPNSKNGSSPAGAGAQPKAGRGGYNPRTDLPNWHSKWGAARHAPHDAYRGNSGGFWRGNAKWKW